MGVVVGGGEGDLDLELGPSVLVDIADGAAHALDQGPNDGESDTDPARCSNQRAAVDKALEQPVLDVGRDAFTVIGYYPLEHVPNN